MEPKYTFDDIILEPRFSRLRSRQEADTSMSFGSLKLKTPIISANMETISGPEMCIAMRKAGGLGALHRFQTVEQNVEDYKKVTDVGSDCLVSIGVSGDFKERTKALYEAGASMFVIDIAHGHSIQMKETIEWLRKEYKNKIHITAGNIATAFGARDLIDWGADAIKCGVGPGSLCTTRLVTGHGVPQFSAIRECVYMTMQKNKTLIADGGIKNSGDIVKAIAAGADCVMIGSLLAGAKEAPGEEVEGGKYKIYKGSSSYDRKGITKEGIETKVLVKGYTKDIIETLTGGIRSGMSYSDSFTLEELYKNARPKVQSMSAIIEASAHIHNKK